MDLMPIVQSLMRKANVTGIGMVHYSPYHYNSWLGFNGIFSTNKLYRTKNK